ncbi:MAG: AbrB/MazE/SpoVT family DNA-binding domain-containing protein [Clostridiales bacterium]|nr:AbrB/MazE/SpoVT family DNA-binding domain-containing protein [Clostridiales bacterium]
MQTVRVTPDGQLTLPKEIREKLGLKNGGKITFIENDENVIIKNQSILALNEVQEAFKGEFQKAGLKNEADVVQMIKEYRRSKQ